MQQSTILKKERLTALNRSCPAVSIIDNSTMLLSFRLIISFDFSTPRVVGISGLNIL